MRAFLSTVFCSLIRIARKHLRAPPLLETTWNRSRIESSRVLRCSLRAEGAELYVIGKRGLDTD